MPRNGNLTDDEEYTFYYDHANHLVRAVRQDGGDTVGEYHYDALGRRVRKVVDDVSDTLDGTTLFYYDGMRVIEEGRLDESADYQATHQYVWGLEYLDELLVYDYDGDGDGDFDDIGSGDQRYYTVQDFLYSTAAVIDQEGTVVERYDYNPYGGVNIFDGDYSDTAPRSETQVHLHFLYTGQMYDAETGLHHYKERALHPTLGRCAQRDLLDGLNLFEYSLSTPHALVDPLAHIIRDKSRRDHGNGLLGRVECGQSANWRIPARRPFDDTLLRATHLFVSSVYPGRGRFQGRTDQFRCRAVAAA